MKKKFVIALSIICVLSIFINVITAVNDSQNKKSFLFGTYSHLVSVSKLLENLEWAILSNNESIIMHTLSDLEIASVKLDISVSVLSTLSRSNQVQASNQFQDLYKVVSKAATASDKESKQVIHEVAQYREEILQLIGKLSPNNELSIDEYDTLIINPNYSLSLKRVVYEINKALENLPACLSASC